MRRVRTLAGLAFLSLLTACGTDLVPWGDSSVPAKPSAPKAGIQEVTLQPSAGAAGSASAATGTEAHAKLPPINDDPQQLIGLGPKGLADRLGSPGFVRRDGAAEIWQYLADSCILDVFLYRDQQALSVDYIELRGRGAAGVSRRDCFRNMLRAHLDTTRS